MPYPRGWRPAALAVLVCALGFTASASASTNNTSFSIATYPAGFFGPDTTNSTGYYSGSVNTPATSDVSEDTQQVRAGAVISTNDSGSVGIAAGDVFNVVNHATGAILASTTYAGLPVFDPTSCIGQNGFSGKRPADASVSVSSVVPVQRGNGRYSYYASDRVAAGHVRTLGDGTFAGVLDSVITAGSFLEAQTDNESVSSDTSTSVSIDSITPAAACPAPTAPLPPAPDKTAPTVSTFDLGSPHISVSLFVKYGFTSFVTISEPGTVTQDMYLNNGAKVPATAAKAKKKKTTKKASKKLTLIGRGQTVSAVAGTVKVTVKASKAGKKALKGKKTVKVVLVTTVKDKAGNVTTLAPKKLTLAG